MNFDALFDALHGLANEKSWTQSKKSYHNALIELTSGDEFFRYVGRAECFNLKRLPHTGETALFWVPDAKRGRFEKFSGQEIIAICTGNADRYNRNIAIIQSSHAPRLREYVFNLDQERDHKSTSNEDKSD